MCKRVSNGLGSWLRQGVEGRCIEPFRDRDEGGVNNVEAGTDDDGMVEVFDPLSVNGGSVGAAGAASL